jgi:hypothetical protein
MLAQARIARICVVWQVCACVRERAGGCACGRVWLAPHHHHHLRHPCKYLSCLRSYSRCAASLALPTSLAPSFSFAPLVSPAWLSRCMHHLRRSRPESLSPLALPALLAQLAPLEPFAQLACGGSVVRFRTSLTPIVPLASPARKRVCVRVRACVCVRACVSERARLRVCVQCAWVRACVCACVGCLRACGPGAIGQAACQARSSGPGCPGPGARGPGAGGPYARAELMWELL